MFLVVVLRLGLATLCKEIEFPMIIFRVTFDTSAIAVAVIAIVGTLLAGQFVIILIVPCWTSRITNIVCSEIVPYSTDSTMR